MAPGRRGGHPAPRGAHQQALLHQERLVHVLDRLGLLADADGQRRQARPGRRRSGAQMASRMARSTLSRPSSSTPNRARPVVGRGLGRRCRRPRTSAKSRTRRSRRLAMRGVPRDRRAISAAPAGVEAARPGCRADRRTMASRSAGLVVVEPGDEAEPVAQRPGDQPGAGGGADQGEPGQVEADRPGRRALAEHDVELEVLHGRVQDLLDRPAQAVDLVDEQHVALGQVGEDGGQVAGPHQRRART